MGSQTVRNNRATFTLIVPTCMYRYMYNNFDYYSLHDVLRFHLCYSMCQNFLPFQHRILVHCMYILHFIYPFIYGGHLNCLYLWVIENNAAMDMGVRTSPWDLTFNSFRFMPQSGIARSNGYSIFTFPPTILWPPDVKS